MAQQQTNERLEANKLALDENAEATRQRVNANLAASKEQLDANAEQWKQHAKERVRLTPPGDQLRALERVCASDARLCNSPARP